MDQVVTTTTGQLYLMAILCGLIGALTSMIIREVMK